MQLKINQRFLCLYFVLGLSGIAYAGPDPLGAVDCIYVVGLKLSPTLAKYGITDEQLETAIELRLRRNGLPVVDSVPDDPGFECAVFGAWVGSLVMDDGLIVYRFDCNLEQSAITSCEAIAVLARPIADSELSIIGARKNPTEPESESSVCNRIMIARLRPHEVAATIWSDGSLGCADPPRFRDQFARALEELIDRFSNKWLVAHGK